MRPALRIDGQPAPHLDRDLVDALVVERADDVRCTVTLLNWGDVDGVPGYVHFDGMLVPGRELGLALADGLVFTGVMASIEARYPGDQPPTLIVAASGTLESAADGPSPRLALGAALRACAVRWTDTALRGEQATVAEGTADFDARIRVGTAVDLAGLGGPNDAAYDVAEVRHRFDTAGGLRSEFVAVRRAWVA